MHSTFVCTEINIRLEIIGMNIRQKRNSLRKKSVHKHIAYTYVYMNTYICQGNNLLQHNF